MRLFFKNSIIFAVTFFILIFTMSVMLNGFILKPNNFEISQKHTTIVLGHSQAACAYNDSIIDDFGNYAGSMEGYFYTYYKLKKIAENNRHITTVLLECTNNQFVSWAHNRIYGEYMPILLPKYFPIIDNEGLSFLFKKNSVEVIRAYTKSQKKKISYLCTSNQNYFNYYNIVGFISRKGCLKQSQIDSILMRNNKRNLKYNEKDVSFENLEYLNKITELCKQYHIKLCFVRSPMPAYMKQANELFFINTIQQKYPEIPFIDLKNFPLTNNDFNDNLHLNYVGANKVSAFVNTLLKSNSIDDNTFQVKIDSVIKNSLLLN